MKEKFTAVYDFFYWHGVGPVILWVLVVLLIIAGLTLAKARISDCALRQEIKSLHHEIKRNRIDNQELAMISMDSSHQVISVGDLYYQGVCQLQSVDFDKNGNTCHYRCWWKGPIGGFDSYHMTLPCGIQSE